MDPSRPKVLKSKIPVKVPVKSRNQLPLPITERKLIEKEEKGTSHAQSTAVKKRTQSIKAQQTVNSNNKYNCTSTATKSNSSDDCRRSGIKTEFKKPLVPVKKNENKQFSSTTFKNKIHNSAKTSNKETHKQNDLSVRNGTGKEVKQTTSNPTKKKIMQSVKQSNDFPTSENEEQSKHSNHITQQNITFEADERYRHLILSGKELTPSMLNSCSSKKRSFTYERPSLYKKFETPANPYQEILKAIENRDLIAEDRRVSELKKVGYSSPIRVRNSLYKQCIFTGDPIQEALNSVAELRIKQKLKDKKKVTFNLPAADPLSVTLPKGENYKTENNKERNSLYKQCIFVGDPYQEALNSLAELRNKQQLKDKKKVTFSLPATDPLSATISKNENCNTETSKSRLTNISERSYRSNSPSIPGGNILSEPNNIPSIEVTPSTPVISNNNDINKTVYENCLFRSIEENKPDFCTDVLSIATPPSYSHIPNTKDSTVLKSGKSLFQEKLQANIRGLNVFGSEIRRSFMQPSNPLFNSIGTSELRRSLYSARSEQPRQKIFSKLCTPKPISFNRETKLNENISPEFLSRRTSNILSHAPINTPLVLKSLAKCELDNCELSPVCKKLDFSDSPKTSYKEDEDSSKSGDSKENTQTFCLQSILTQQKILDQLAHQECNILMHETTFPSNLRSHLLNPIARILLEGDEMHFVPVTMM